VGVSLCVCVCVSVCVCVCVVCEYLGCIYHYRFKCCTWLENMHLRANMRIYVWVGWGVGMCVFVGLFVCVLYVNIWAVCIIIA
jgi:hypothetical protein